MLVRLLNVEIKLHKVQQVQSPKVGSSVGANMPKTPKVEFKDSPDRGTRLTLLVAEKFLLCTSVVSLDVL